MSEVSFPARFEELSSSSNNGFNISNPELIIGMDAEEITQYIQELIESGSDLENEAAAEKAVEFIYCALDMFANFSKENQSMFVQYLLDLAKSAIGLLPSAPNTSTKNAYKKILYLFQHFCAKAELSLKNATTGTAAASTTTGKGKSKKTNHDEFSWTEFRTYALEVLDQLVSSPLSASWPMGLVQENFLSGVWNYALKLLVDRPAGVGGTAHKEIATRVLCVKIFARTVGHFGNAKSSSSYATVSTALLEAIVQCEHVALSTGAELCHQSRLLAPSQGSLIVSEILSEISRMNYTHMPATSIKNIASFLEAFAKLSPSAVAEAFPILMKQLDSPAHQIRSAIIHACGYIVTHIHEIITAQSKPTSDASTATQAAGNVVEADGNGDGVATTSPVNEEERNTTGLVRSRDNILDILIERAHDTNPYTRTTVLKVWSRLLESGSLPVKRVGNVAMIAVDRLFDRNAAVRRNAVVLMTTSIENNPFSGTLDAALYKLQQSELQRLLEARLAELRAAHKEGAEGNSGGSGGGEKKMKKEKLGAISEDAEEEEEDGEESGSEDDNEASQQAAAEAAEEEAEFMESAEVQMDSTVVDCRAKLDYINSVLGMIGSIESAVPKIATMLQSKTTGDVVEALRFFTRAINFKIAGALGLFKSAFSLVWHQDPSIKAEMLLAFSAVYLTDGAGEHAESLGAAEIASNLMHLVKHCDASEVTSMEKIVGEMFHAKQVDEEVIEEVWDKIEHFHHDNNNSNNTSRKSPTTTATTINNNTNPTSGVFVSGVITELGACLRIISMIAHSVPGILTTDRVGLIISAGLNAEVLQRGDFSALKAAVLCLQATPALLKQCHTATERNKYVGSALQVALLEATPVITQVLLGTVCGDSEAITREWFSLCEEAMHTLFHIHPAPDRVVSLVLQHMYAHLDTVNSSTRTDSADVSVSAEDNTTTAGNSGRERSVCGIARLLFVLGQTSLCSLVYTELVAAVAKKYPLKDADSANKTDAKKKSAKNTTATASAKSSTTFKEDEGEVDAMEEEMGAAAAADADQERLLNQVIEQELVLRNLLGKFLPLLSYVVANEQKKFSHPLLRETSILALCRYMCTSSVVCDQLLPLLFTVLERETAVTVRTSVMIALGDLAFRFPNSIEPWTPRMYARLRDESVVVRYNTLMVITHLVLNDMIKVKGQVSHVAYSINDPNENIAELAKLFFIKLSERSNNPVYNLLGDIISVFSQDSQDPSASTVTESQGSAGGSNSSGASGTVLPALSKEEFQSTMHFLLSFVSKDKQADTLLERLLLRMSMSTSLLQRRNLAFCVSELSVTEKGVKKMIELIKNIKDALYDNEVYECFRTTLARAKKVVRGVGTTAETKTAMDEFEQLMERIHSQANGEEVAGEEGGLLDLGDVAVALQALDAEDGAEDSGRPVRAGRSAAATKPKARPAAKKPAAKKAAGGAKKRSTAHSSDDEGSDGASASENDSEGEAPVQKASAKGKAKAAPKAAPARGRRAVISDDEEED